MAPVLSVIPTKGVVNGLGIFRTEAYQDISMSLIFHSLSKKLTENFSGL